MVSISVESVVISPLLFLIASIWLFSLFFFINLANGLSILLIFSKYSSWIYWFVWSGFRVSIAFSYALILVISFLLGFEVFWSCFLALPILMIGCQFWISPSSHVGIYCYQFSSRDCFKCVPEILVHCVFILIGFKEHLYFCLHFIVCPVNIQAPVLFPWSCAVLS